MCSRRVMVSDYTAKRGLMMKIKSAIISVVLFMPLMLSSIFLHYVLLLPWNLVSRIRARFPYPVHHVVVADGVAPTEAAAAA